MTFAKVYWTWRTNTGVRPRYGMAGQSLMLSLPEWIMPARNPLVKQEDRMVLNKLSPAALRAAMTTGTDEWGRWGSATEHSMYVEPVNFGRRWRLCRCGCRKRVTHAVFANGVALANGCELSIHRFIRKLKRG